MENFKLQKVNYGQRQGENEQRWHPSNCELRWIYKQVLYSINALAFGMQNKFAQEQKKTE